MSDLELESGEVADADEAFGVGEAVEAGVADSCAGRAEAGDLLEGAFGELGEGGEGGFVVKLAKHPDEALDENGVFLGEENLHDVPVLMIAPAVNAFLLDRVRGAEVVEPFVDGWLEAGGVGLGYGVLGGGEEFFGGLAAGGGEG